jgi:hypothetical protein
MKIFLINTIIVFVLSVLPNFIIGIIRLKKEEPIPYVLNKMKSVKADSEELSINNKPTYGKPIGDMSRLSLLKGDSVLRYVDNFGFSNIVVNKSPEILFIGDSFLNDPGVSTNEGIQAQTNKLLNKNISYNIGSAGSAGFRVYNKFCELSFKKKPRLIIFEVVERNLSNVLLDAPNELRSNAVKSVPKENYYLDLVFGNNFKNLYTNKLVSDISKRNQHVGLGTARMYEGNKVWFLNNGIKTLSTKNIDAMVDSMLAVKKILDEQKIKIVFVFAPDKESVYPKLFGTSSLRMLHSKMKAKNLEFIDMLSLFKNQGEKYYYDGDTHWNLNSVRLLSKEVSKKYQYYFSNGSR